ncbi:MAG: 6-hydroxymethylpterin diphosphokinase MptE-like protein [Candidatus Bathyarchaeia archaeon]
MDIDVWRPWYQRIAARLGLNAKLDQAAADLLSSLLSRKGLEADALKAKFRGRSLLVAGAGPSLEKNIQSLLDADLLRSWAVIAADGATSALIENGVTPVAVVSDLDGNMDDILYAGKQGSILVVHGHGDNLTNLQDYVPKMSPPLGGSTQVEARRKVYNFGGFTDGDRCVFLCEEAAVDTVVLIGMDLGTKVGPYSKPLGVTGETLKRKRLKLSIAKELLAWLAQWTRCRVYNATGAGEPIPFIKNISIRELENQARITVQP